MLLVSAVVPRMLQAFLVFIFAAKLCQTYSLPFIADGPEFLYPPPLDHPLLGQSSPAAVTYATVKGPHLLLRVTHISGDRANATLSLPCIAGSSVSTLLITLALSGDVHPHPGPALGEGIYPCGFCDLKCTWSDDNSHGGAVCCDDCSMWYHRNCIDMRKSEYENLNSVSWHCIRCKHDTINSFTFHDYATAGHDSDFPAGDDSVFHPNSNTSSVTSPAQASDFVPGAASSPRLSADSSESTGSFMTLCDSDNIRIVYNNSNSIGGKTAELANLLDYTKPHVYVAVETKLDKSVYSSEFLPKNYQQNVFRRDRNKNGGGVLIAHRDGVVASPVKLKGIGKDCEVTVSKVSTSGGQPPLYVVAYYRSQTDNSPNTSLDGLESVLKQITPSHSKATIVVVGDFNCPGIDWDSLRPGSKVVSVSEKLINIAVDFGIEQQQKDPTRQDSVLDLFFTNNKSLMSNLCNIPGISTVNEHDTLVADLKLRAEIQKSAPHKIYQWGRAKWSRIKGETRAFATRFCSDSGRSVEDQWSSIENHISKMMKEHVPSKFSKTRTDQPWVTPDLKRKCRKKQRLYKKWKRHCGGARGSESGACRAAREEYKRYHKHTNALLRKSRTQYIGKILGDDLDSGNNKAFWRYIKSQRTESSGVAPLKDKGQLCSGPLGKAKILANQFKSVFTRDKDEDKDTHLHGPGYPSIGNITFDTVGIEKLLRGVNPSKAAGPDQIPCRMLHELATELAPVFTKLFQNSYNSGILPQNWRNAWISPVFKKDDKSEASNYRPVSLTCVACKIMEHVVASHIRNFLDKHGILSPYQHGFRKKLSCEKRM